MKSIEVQIGQIWQDWDTRYRQDKHPRLLKVVDIWTLPITLTTYITCRNLKTGRYSEINIKRMKPTSNGYKLVKE